MTYANESPKKFKRLFLPPASTVFCLRQDWLRPCHTPGFEAQMQKQQQSGRAEESEDVNLQRRAVNKSRRQRWRTCCSTEGYGVTRTHRDTELPAAAALPRQCPEVTWDPLHRAECVPATVTAPRFK